MTAPHYGKRNLGVGTAASPGDSLYFFFGTYNDSGNSEGDTGFSVTDIEVYKDNGTTPRLTDSGYALITDTGTPGLRRFRVQLFNTADDATFYANGSWYQVAVDNIKIDGKLVRLWAGSFEIGEPRANVVQIAGDTGFADRVGKFGSLLSGSGQIDTGTVFGGFIPANIRQINSDTGAAVHVAQVFANGFNDTGLTNRFDRIQSEVDTGLRVHIDDLDTGLHAHISDVDTGVHSILQTVGVLVAAISDTGVNQRLGQIQSDVDTGLRTHIDDLDTGLANLNVNINQIRGDTGGADRFFRYTQKLDTGGDATVSASVDTGIVNQAVWQGNAARSITNVGDTGIVNSLQIIRFDVDTGLRAQISDVDTGLHDTLADYDTGIRALLALRDTGAIATAVWAGDTGLRDHITNVDTGLTNRLSIIASDTDTGLKTVPTAIKAKTDSLTFTVAGQVDSNVVSVNEIAVNGSGTSGDPWGP